MACFIASKRESFFPLGESSKESISEETSIQKIFKN